MIGLLTVMAVIATLSLIVSATSTASRATAGDRHRRGPWGIVQWTPDRSRPLNPHERRWQTALLSGKENASRWPDLVAEIQTLENLSGTTPVAPAPASHNAGWLRDSLANLESSTAATTNQPNPPGETTQ